jgi:prolipoprotein diacylglyceryltransferase
MKKVLITGATGKVGSRFALRMLAKGYDVRILVRDAAKASALVERGAQIFISFFILFVRKRDALQSGRIFFGASALMFVCRFAVEFIRRNPRYDGLSLSQWICIPLILIYASLYIWLTLRNVKAVAGNPVVVETNFSTVS